MPIWGKKLKVCSVAIMDGTVLVSQGTL